MTLETLEASDTTNKPGHFPSEGPIEGPIESKDRRVNADAKPFNLPFPDRRKRGRLSSFAVAIALFFAVNFGMSFYTPIDFDPYRFPYQGWAWWTFNDLKASNELHNVALLGSSLMVSAVSCCDANHLNKQLDLTSYHKASYLDDKLTSTFAGKFNTYNLSAPGQMPSDAYLTLKGMLTTAHRPEIVIYGVAPRDFIDSRMSSPTDTEPFRFLNRLVNTDDCVSALFRDPLGRLEWLINRNLYVSHHAVDFQMLNGDQVKAILDKATPVPPCVKAYTYWDRTKLMPLYKPGEIHSQAIITQPTSRPQATAEWRDNTVEYIERYRHPDRHTYKTQFYFLRKLAQLCKQEKIELILVNMPIAKENIAVLKPEAYLKFVFGLQQFAIDQKVATYDLNDFNHYDKSDYHDYVHLNAFGAKKLFDNLVNTLKNAPHTNLAMRMAGQELVRQEANQNHYSDKNTIQSHVLQERLKNAFGKLGNSVDPALQYVPSDLNQNSNSNPNSNTNTNTNSTKIGAKTRGAEM